MIVPGMFVCSDFLISVCMFIVLKALLISRATVIVRAGAAIWLNSFATVLFSVFCTRVSWLCLVCLLLCKEECSSPVSLQLELCRIESKFLSYVAHPKYTQRQDPS